MCKQGTWNAFSLEHSLSRGKKKILKHLVSLDKQNIWEKGSLTDFSLQEDSCSMQRVKWKLDFHKIEVLIFAL